MNFTTQLAKGLKAAFQNRWMAITTLSFSSFFFILLALSTSINYSIQMISSGFQYWLPAISFTLRGLYLNGGWTGVGLNLVYTLLVGVVVQNTYIQFKVSGLDLENLSGLAPGILVAGCAGCGVSILSLVGVTGLAAMLPFHGTGIKLVGIVLILYFIARIGNPKTCSIPVS